MTKMHITLDPDDRRWLARQAGVRGVSMAELVREAIHRWRREEESAWESARGETSGIWRGEDGLAFQNRLRGEWE